MRADEKTLTGTLPTLADFANLATFMASDQASAMTGTITNMSSGVIVD